MQRKTALLAGGVTLLGGALEYKGVKAFATFDDAMNQSLAIMGNVSVGMRADMAQAARAMAKQTVFSADDAAKSYFYLASAGLDAKQSIVALPQVAQFAQAGMFDMAQATELLMDAQSALGLTSKDATKNLQEMTRVSDVLVKANTLANATVQQFAESLANRAAPRMRQMNMSLEEGVSVLAAFAKQGIKGRRAGTVFDMTIRELARRARENADAFRDANVAVFNESGAMRDMADIVQDLENHLQAMTTKQRDAALAQLGFQQRSIRGILALIGMSDALRNYETSLQHAAGTTREVAGKQLESLIKQLGILGSTVHDVMIRFGALSAPTIEEGVRGLTHRINELSTGMHILGQESQDAQSTLGNFNRIFNPLMLPSNIKVVWDTIFDVQDKNLSKARENLKLASDWLDAIQMAPKAFVRLAGTVDHTRENLDRFHKIFRDLPASAAPFVSSLGQAETVLRIMDHLAKNSGLSLTESLQNGDNLLKSLNAHGVSLEEILKKAGISIEHIDNVQKGIKPQHGFLPSNPNEIATTIKDITTTAQSNLNLAKAELRTHEDTSAVMKQILSSQHDINAALAERENLTHDQVTALLNQKADISEFLKNNSEVAKALAEATSNADSLVNRYQLLGKLGENQRSTAFELGHMFLRILQLRQQASQVEGAIGEKMRQEAMQAQAQLDQFMKPQTGVVQPGTGFTSQTTGGGAVSLTQPLPNIIERGQTAAALLSAHKTQDALSKAWSHYGKQFGRQMANIGTNLVLSLAGGMDNASDAVKQVAMQIFSALINIGLRMLLIGSPSRVMNNMGRNVTLGLAEGIAAESDKAQKAWMGVLSGLDTNPSLGINPMLSANAAGASAASSALARLRPEVSLNIDTSNMPKPKTPFDVARDHEWQKTLRTSIEIARKDGFK